MPQTNPHVVVIGGGPAGSTASTLIAKEGFRVELFEREHFPRFHIGESLIPETYWVLQPPRHARQDAAKASSSRNTACSSSTSTASCPSRSTLSNTSRMSVRRPGKSSAASSTS